MAASAREFFESIESRVDPSRLKGTTASYRFDIQEAGSWHVDVRDGVVRVTEDDADAECVIAMSEKNFSRLARGELKPTTAYMTGKLKVSGDMGLALKLKELFA